MLHAWSLRNKLADELRARNILSYREVVEIAEEGGWKSETATRRLRYDEPSVNGELSYIPCIKLNNKKKRLKKNEAWAFVKWDGGTTIFKKK